MIDLMNLPAEEAERLAYAEEFAMASKLFARIAELESINRALECEADILRDELTVARYERAYSGEDD